MAELLAVQAQMVVTATDPVAPEVGNEALVGLMATVQFCPPCRTKMVLLLMRMLPVRVVGVGLEAMEYVMEPSAEPLLAP